MQVPCPQAKRALFGIGDVSQWCSLPDRIQTGQFDHPPARHRAPTTGSHLGSTPLTPADHPVPGPRAEPSPPVETASSGSQLRTTPHSGPVSHPSPKRRRTLRDSVRVGGRAVCLATFFTVDAGRSADHSSRTPVDPLALHCKLCLLIAWPWTDLSYPIPSTDSLEHVPLPPLSSASEKTCNRQLP